MCKKFITLLLVLGICSVASAGGAWDNDASDNLWSTAANWDADTLPTSSNNADIKMIGAGKCIIDSTTTAVPALAQQVFMGLGSGQAGELEITGGILNGSSGFAIGEATGGTGTLTMTGGSVTMLGGMFNRGGNATINITGGNLNLDQQIYLGQNVGAVTNMTIGGTAHVTTTADGFDTAAGSGTITTLNMTGGTYSGGWSLSLGRQAGGTGILNMTSGSFQTAQEVVVGWAGEGTVTMDGGTIQTGGPIMVARDAGSKGTIHMNAGLWTGPWEIQVNNDGTLNMAGGTIDAQHGMWSGKGASGSGLINMTGGSIDCEWVMAPQHSQAGTGLINLHGGVITGTHLEFGNDADSSGAMDITEGVLIISANETATVESLATDGYLTGHDGINRGWYHTGSYGLLRWDWDNVNSGKMTVWTIPEPTTIALLGLGGLVLLRKKRR